MEYRYLTITNADDLANFYKMDYDTMIQNSEECDKLNISDSKLFRIIIDNIEYRLMSHYLFMDKGITLYVMEKKKSCI